MASGWWDNDGAIAGCVAAYAPVGAADLASSYVNLVTPGTYNAAPGVAPTWNTVTGWTFNGSTQWLTLTGLRLSGITTRTVIARISGMSGGFSVRLIVSTTTLSLRASTGGDNRINFVNAGNATGTVVLAGEARVLAVAGNQGYLDGVANGSTWSFGSSGNFADIAVGATPGGGNYVAGSVQAVALYNATLSAADVQTITTRMNALPEPSGSALPILLAQHAMMG